MEFCEYCKVGQYDGFCNCTIENNYCMFVRRCQTEHRWKPVDAMQACALKIIHNQKLQDEGIELKKNEYKVVTISPTKLYLENKDGEMIRISNPYGDKTVPKTVTIVTIDGVNYIKGFTPSKDDE